MAEKVFVIPEWRVYYGDFNARRIKSYNIFNHGGFLRDAAHAAKKLKNREAFEHEIDICLRYYFWSKCEWEIILQHWPHKEGFRDEKIDVYDQVMLNRAVFMDYMWNHRKDIIEYPERFKRMHDYEKELCDSSGEKPAQPDAQA